MLSLIIPAYKVEKYLHVCLDRILAQSFSDYEILLVNDGSPDNSGQICDEYAARDSRVKVFHKENGGVSSARNLALEHVSGEWIFFIDSDDWIENGCLEQLQGYLNDSSLDLVQFNTSRTDLNYNIKTAYFPSLEAYSTANYFQPALWNYFFRASVIKDNGLRFSKELKYAEDFEFVLKYFAHVRAVQTTDLLVYNYVPADDSAMNRIPVQLFTQNNFSAVNGVIDYVAAKDVYKGFYVHNLYVFLKYILRTMPKFKINKEEFREAKSRYKGTFKKLVTFDSRFNKFLLLKAADISLSNTLTLIKLIWR
ncbi:glycosyltransferase family 2 protein [Flavobacterium sp. RHBU_3]|uniref:glycosyltransferase family 2 protein n=1 Tax=Flavobacterium sp. RHBU_3 TaxID=3391184 RepID=UPI00398490DA